MTLVRAFVAVAGCTVACTVIGVGLGMAVGHFAPGFYRATLPTDRLPDFDPVQVGVGFGINAGVFAGIVIGLVVVAIVTYFEFRNAGRTGALPEVQREAAPASRGTDAIRASYRPER
jgi:hypothetical protein